MHFDRMSVIIYVQEGAVNVMKYFCCLLSSGAKQRATGDNEVYTATLHFFFFLGCKTLQLSCRSYIGDHF